MEKSDEKFELRNTHKWKDNKCIYCGCERIEIENPNAKWNWKQYVDTETGEITRKYQCKSKQLVMDI